MSKSFLLKLLGPASSDRYPEASYVSMVLRRLSFLFAALGLLGLVLTIFGLIASSFRLMPSGGLVIAGPVLLIYGFLGFVLFLGVAELLNVMLGIEKNTRESCDLLRSMVKEDSEES